MTETLEILSYLDFYDVPRIFLVRHRNRLVLFDSPFDPSRDEYSSTYRAYEMPDGWTEPPNSDWGECPPAGSRPIKTVPIESVLFDETRRRSISVSFLE